MALSKRRKAEIKTAQDEVINHSEMIRLMVEGKVVEEIDLQSASVSILYKLVKGRDDEREAEGTSKATDAQDA